MSDKPGRRRGEAQDLWAILFAEPHVLNCGCHPLEYDNLNSCVRGSECQANRDDLVVAAHPDGIYRDPRCEKWRPKCPWCGSNSTHVDGDLVEQLVHPDRETLPPYLYEWLECDECHHQFKKS